MNSLRKIILLIVSSILIPWDTWALECKWWQTKVKTATIPQHQREGYKVSEHVRQEHCRERWKGADQHIKQFKNESIQGWGKKEEAFKKWSNTEIQIILELLANLPAWAKTEEFIFHRANKSIHQGNPATSELTKKAIVLYDKFFDDKDKLATLGHEVSHFLFQNLSSDDLLKFSELSGWDLEIKEDKIFVVPPKKPLKPDSVINKEEDFSNYMEFYISNSKELKKQHPKMFEFLSKRYPL